MRLAALAVAVLAIEAVGIVACGALWLAFGAGRALHTRPAQRAHFALQHWWFGALLGAAEGSDGHLLDADAWFVDDVIPNGSAAAIALVEHRWAIPLRETIWDAGGFHLADAWVHPEDLLRIGMRAAEEIEEP